MTSLHSSDIIKTMDEKSFRRSHKPTRIKIIKKLRDWNDLLRSPVGKIVYSRKITEDIWFIIIRGPASLCAYLGVPLNHPLAGKQYNEINIPCHGSLTFAGAGTEGKGDRWRPKGWYWYGWDYGHMNDYFFFYDKPEFFDIFQQDSFHKDETKWLPKNVINDSKETIKEFKKLVECEKEK